MTEEEKAKPSEPVFSESKDSDEPFEVEAKKEKEKETFIEIEPIDEISKDIEDPLVKLLTKEAFYVSLLVGLVTISIFLYDKVKMIDQIMIIDSVGLIWISLLSKYIGHMSNSKNWKDASALLMFLSVFLQGVIVIRLLIQLQFNFFNIFVAS